MNDSQISLISTGDLLLFRRKDMVGKWIQSLTYSRWTHVAIAVRIEGDSSDDFKVVDSGGSLYVMETILDEWDHDFLSQKVKKDFRLSPIEYRMKKDYSLIGYRSLNRSLVNKNYLKKTKKFLLDHKDSKFYKNEFQLFKLWLGLDPQRKECKNEDEKEYCCTTIVAKYLNKVLGIKVSENLIPHSFDYYECDHHGFMLRDYYSPEEIIWTHYEQWHESIGLLLVFLIAWIVFWWLTSSWIFGK